MSNQDAKRSTMGRAIASVTVDGTQCRITFADGHTLSITDEGQSCCESRYMTCDDDLASFVGAEIRDIYVDGGIEPPVEVNNFECHDYEFVRIVTTAGTIVLANHNEHNGYYGGFAVEYVFS